MKQRAALAKAVLLTLQCFKAQTPLWQLIHSFIHSFIHNTPSNPQISVAADILWQPSSLPCLGISSTM